MAKLYYFCFFGAAGCMAPYFNVYLQQIGLNGTEIGWLGSIPPLVALAANPFWGAIADRWQIHRQVLAICALGAALISLTFLQVNSFVVIGVLVTILTFFRVPISAIVDSAVIDLVKKQVNTSYGRQRVWGTFSFVALSFGLGQLVTPGNFSTIFLAHAAFLGLGCVVLSLLLPVQSAAHRVSLQQGMRILLGQRQYITFLLAAALLGMGMASYISFLGLYILKLGGTERQIGLAWACEAIMEIPMMYFGMHWLARYSRRQVILAGMLGLGLIWLLIGLCLTPTQVIIVVLGLGFCFGSFWMAAVDYVNAAAPPGLSATAQTLFGAALGGLGWSLGAVASGYLWDWWGGQAVFFFAGSMPIAATVVFGLGSREKI